MCVCARAHSCKTYTHIYIYTIYCKQNARARTLTFKQIIFIRTRRRRRRHYIRIEEYTCACMAVCVRALEITTLFIYFFPREKPVSQRVHWWSCSARAKFQISPRSQITGKRVGIGNTLPTTHDRSYNNSNNKCHRPSAKYNLTQTQREEKPWSCHVTNDQ